MSYYLIIDKYKEEIKKISLTRFLKETMKMDYSIAKNDVDKIVEGVPVVYKFSSKKALVTFRETVSAYGVLTCDIFAGQERTKSKTATVHKKPVMVKK